MPIRFVPTSYNEEMEVNPKSTENPGVHLSAATTRNRAALIRSAQQVLAEIGPDATVEALLETVRALSPANEPGRVVLVTRFGAHRIGQSLPPLLRAVRAAGLDVAWVCDPMHGNTETVVPTGGAWAGKSVKTRKFGHVLAEVQQAIEIHRSEGTMLAGVHVELTGENVTECTGGARGLTDDDLARAYRSQVDPRLNYEQALELAMLIARHA